MQTETSSAMASQGDGEEKVVECKAEAKKLDTKDDGENQPTFSP